MNTLEIIIPPLTSVTLVLALMVYRTKRRFVKHPVKGVWNFIERNPVEIIIALILIPDLMGLFLKLANGG